MNIYIVFVLYLVYNKIHQIMRGSKGKMSELGDNNNNLALVKDYKVTIWLVDDQVAILMVLNNYLNNHLARDLSLEFHIEKFYTAEEVKNVLKDQIPDIIIIDNNMEKENAGVELVDYICKEFRENRPKLVIMSADRINHHSADFFLEKPFFFNDLGNYLQKSIIEIRSHQIDIQQNKEME